AYLGGLSPEQRQAIEVVSIDPYEPYRQAIRAELPGARIVADRFHLVRGANTALDTVRRERQRQVGRRRPKGARRSGHLATWAPELFRVRRLLATAGERLSERERRRLCALFAADRSSARPGRSRRPSAPSTARAAATRPRPASIASSPPPSARCCPPSPP